MPLVHVQLISDQESLQGLQEQIAELRHLLADPDLDCSAEVLLSLFEVPAKLIHLEYERRTTGGACELRVFFQPTELFLEILAAARAGFIDPHLLDKAAHATSFAVKGLTERK